MKTLAHHSPPDKNTKLVAMNRLDQITSGLWSLLGRAVYFLLVPLSLPPKAGGLEDWLLHVLICPITLALHTGVFLK